MIRSMTAFADGEMAMENLIIHCELRSVNHRYSDISVKLPERLRFAEVDVRRLISEKLKRGKIECCLMYKKQLTAETFAINHDFVEKLLATTTELEKRMDKPRSFSALDVLAYPGVQQENEIDKELLRAQIIQLIQQTLEKMLDTRSREGAQIISLINARCQQITALVQAGRLRMPEVHKNLRSKLLAKVQELQSEPHFDRLEMELLLLAQKMDVAEELDRLDTHINEVIRSLNQPEPVGRRLDFLMQELNREANTLGSKSADKEMTQISIDLKVLIEQMREQIQNIE